jgi:hypothetical protein
VRFRAFHELFRWDERQIFISLEGLKMRGNHPDEAWGPILASLKPHPVAPPVWVRLSDSAIALQPAKSADQLELGAIVFGLPDWRISNQRDVIDPTLPFRLRPVLGRDAFTKANSWRRRVYEVPLIIRRDDQRYVAGWDGFHAALAEDPDRRYEVGELRSLGEKAVGATLAGKEAQDFWLARR